MKKNILSLSLLTILLSSCAAIGGIFKAGIWMGILVVIVIIVIIMAIARK